MRLNKILIAGLFFMLPWVNSQAQDDVVVTAGTVSLAKCETILASDSLNFLVEIAYKDDPNLAGDRKIGVTLSSKAYIDEELMSNFVEQINQTDIVKSTDLEIVHDQLSKRAKEIFTDDYYISTFDSFDCNPAQLSSLLQEIKRKSIDQNVRFSVLYLHFTWPKPKKADQKAGEAPVKQ